MSSQYDELRSTSGWDRLAGLGHPSKFQRVSRVGFVTAPTSLNEGQPNFALCLAVSWSGTLCRPIHFRGLLPLTEFCQMQYSLCVQSLTFSFIGGVATRHSSSVRKMAVLCGMPTIQYSARSARLSVRLFKWVCPKITMVKVIWHKAHRRRRRMVQSYSPGGGNVSSHEGTLAPLGEYDWTCASLGPLESTTQTANRSVQPYLHSSRQKVPIIYNGRPYPPKLPLPKGDLEPIWHMIPWAHANPQPKRHLDWFSCFCTDDRRVCLYFIVVRPFPPQKCRFPSGDLDPM